MAQSRVDVAIIGAGTAGAAAAAHCARAGMRVTCLDRGPLDRAGARWVNGVAAQAFLRSGFNLPVGEELRGQPGHGFHLVAGWGPKRVVVYDHGVLEVDMRLLVARLHEIARQAGAHLQGNVAVQSVEGNLIHTATGTVEATWIVDASGLAGQRLLDQPKIPASHLCAAAQTVRKVTDIGAARAFFAQHEVPEGAVLCFTGIAGGFSILNLRLHNGTVSMLSGSITCEGNPSGTKLIEQFSESHSWVGEVIFGGARAIPLRRPFDKLAQGPIALLGDAASQVFSAHGSGIGPGLIAARVLADSLATGGGTHGYAVSWMREFGGLMATYDLFRRLSQTLSIDTIERLIETNVMEPQMVAAGMSQIMPSPHLRSLPNKLYALATMPRIGTRFARTSASMVAAVRLYSKYPEDPAALPLWSRRIARIFGDEPDLAAV